MTVQRFRGHTQTGLLAAGRVLTTSCTAIRHLHRRVPALLGSRRRRNRGCGRGTPHCWNWRRSEKS